MLHRAGGAQAHINLYSTASERHPGLLAEHK